MQELGPERQLARQVTRTCSPLLPIEIHRLPPAPVGSGMRESNAHKLRANCVARMEATFVSDLFLPVELVLFSNDNSITQVLRILTASSDPQNKQLIGMCAPFNPKKERCAIVERDKQDQQAMKVRWHAPCRFWRHTTHHTPTGRPRRTSFPDCQVLEGRNQGASPFHGLSLRFPLPLVLRSPHKITTQGEKAILSILSGLPKAMAVTNEVPNAGKVEAIESAGVRCRFLILQLPT
jgi:hypothetical protein